ncbi:MAG: glycosyltransferase family 4 protein, partial [Planctomycetes bacterium]|nr:glycosyltransferase family 4 protein [Planctomycetota bacterium]
AGQQVNLYRSAEIVSLNRLPSMLKIGLPPSVELARRLPEETRALYVPEILSYPISYLNPMSPGPDEKEELGSLPPVLFLTGNVCGISGWDTVVYEIARGLHSIGASVRLNAASQVHADLLPPSLLPARRTRLADDRELVLCPPHLLEHTPHPPGCFIFTMWESDRLEPNWVEILNQAAAVIVPSQWALDCFQASGVTVPLEIVPLGHDSLTFHANADYPEICTFGTAAALWGGGIRKNTQRLIDAFARAFPHNDDVRLRVKITPRCELGESSDPRIEILRKFLISAELVEWYRSLSAYINGSSAEGFGLHLVEAMACGRPVISTAYSAVTEYFDETVGYPVAHRLVEAECSIYSGRWAELDEDDLVKIMRRVHANQADARRLGQHAATRIRRFTWKEAGRRLLNVLEKHSGTPLTV